MLNIKYDLSKTPKERLDQNNLGFGNYFTDNMFVMDYEKGKGWHSARIVPYGPVILEPSAMVFHYAQESFEGLKAYRTAGNDILLFRPYENIRRMNLSNVRVCIPEIPEEDYFEAIRAIVKTEESWIPSAPGTSLYIRPFVIATDPHIGVRPSDTYSFYIILSPVGAYYKEGLNPVKIHVETQDVRAVKGGTGFAKVGGNYAATIRAQDRVKGLGYSQVLWLDGVERKYIEEVGTMNVFFIIGDEIITPPLEGSILPGVTRKSVLEMLSALGYKVSERRISIDEVKESHKNGTLKEVFGTGTAAVVSPVGELNCNGDKMIINNEKIGDITQRLYDEITAIQWGAAPDQFNWTIKI